MHMLIIAFAICCLAVAESTYQSGHEFQLNSVPDISSYGKLIYPQLGIQELGEFSHGERHPEVINVVKTVEVKVPSPYPVQVPQKVPYPVPYKVPHIIKVPHVVKVSHPVPVEVVKQVEVPKSNDESYGIQNEQFGTELTSGGDYGKASVDSASFNSYNDGHQNDWQGVSSQSYGNPSESYGVSSGAYDAAQGNFGEHGGTGLSDYQQNDYSAAQQTVLAGYGDAGQFGHGGDYSAQASSASAVQQDQSVKEVVEQSQEGPH